MVDDLMILEGERRRGKRLIFNKGQFASLGLMTPYLRITPRDGMLKFFRHLTQMVK